MGTQAASPTRPVGNSPPLSENLTNPGGRTVYPPIRVRVQWGPLLSRGAGFPARSGGSFSRALGTCALSSIQPLPAITWIYGAVVIAGRLRFLLMVEPRLHCPFCQSWHTPGAAGCSWRRSLPGEVRSLLLRLGSSGRVFPRSCSFDRPSLHCEFGEGRRSLPIPVLRVSPKGEGRRTPGAAALELRSV